MYKINIKKKWFFLCMHFKVNVSTNSLLFVQLTHWSGVNFWMEVYYPI